MSVGSVCSCRVHASLAPAAPTDLQLQQQTRGRLERQMIPPDGLARGSPLSFPDAPGAPGRQHTPVTSWAQLGLRPAGRQGATSGGEVGGGSPSHPRPAEGLKSSGLKKQTPCIVPPRNLAHSALRVTRGLELEAQGGAWSAAWGAAAARRALPPHPAARAARPLVLGAVLSPPSGQGRISRGTCPSLSFSCSRRNPPCPGASLTGAILEIS